MGSVPHPCLCSLCGAWTPADSLHEGLLLLEHLPRCAPGQRPVWTDLPAAPSLLENELQVPLDLFVPHVLFQISAQFRHLVGPTAVYCTGPLRRAEVRAGGAVPSRTSRRSLTFSLLVQAFSSLCKPHADKMSLVLAAVGSEQGAGLPGVPAPATRALPHVTGLARFGQSCLGRRQFRKQRASVWAIPVTLKSKHLITFLLCQGWFLSYRLTQYPWIGGKRRLSILHRKLPSPKAFYYFKIYFACFCLAEEAEKDQDKLRAAMREGSWPGTQGVWRRRGERLWAPIPGHWGSLWRHSCTALGLEAGRLSD